MRRWLLVLSLALIAALAGCATAKSKRQRAMEETLMNYASAVRWSGFQQALSFVDPETLKHHPMSDLELKRYDQVRVSYYHEQPPVVNENELTQAVEIGIVNEHTQSERVVVDHQRWRWDAAAQRWWLVSGLPDITRRD